MKPVEHFALFLHHPIALQARLLQNPFKVVEGTVQLVELSFQGVVSRRG